MKVYGALLLILAGTGAGWQAVRMLNERKRRWRAWKELLGRLYDRLSCTGLPLQTLLYECAQDSAYKDLPWLREFRDPAGPLSCPQQYVTPEEAPFLRELFEGFGVSGLEEQCRWLAEFQSRAANYEEDATVKQKQRGRLYLAFGVCSGLCMAVLLM